jgi:hypothetical protein
MGRSYARSKRRMIGSLTQSGYPTSIEACLAVVYSSWENADS